MRVKVIKPVILVIQPGQEVEITNEQFKLVKGYVEKVEAKEAPKAEKKKTKKGD